MRLRRWSRVLAAAALVASAAFALAAGLSFRSAMDAKIGRAAVLEQEAVRPAAAARLAAALVQRRLAQMPDPQSQAVAAAFQRSPAAQALVEYRAAGGDESIAAEAEKSIRSEKPPGPDAEIALMRAVRGLSQEAARAPRASRPPPPAAASRGFDWLLAAEGAAAVAVFLAYAGGHRAKAR
ncbi:MAG TPA: hypothetical protein VKE50_04710 [Thermoanaerobaculia bacterium]|nr:hypothetical protein [Thermoanaerobaculia bacterium]